MASVADTALNHHSLTHSLSGFKMHLSASAALFLGVTFFTMEATTSANFFGDFGKIRSDRDMATLLSAGV